jgi:hypothetical protein
VVASEQRRPCQGSGLIAGLQRLLCGLELLPYRQDEEGSHCCECELDVAEDETLEADAASRPNRLCSPSTTLQSAFT